MVPFSYIKIRRITLQVKKQRYFALAMTTATEAKLKKKMFKAQRFLLQIRSQGLQTGWNPTPYTLNSGRLGCDDALCCRLYCDYGGSRSLRNVGIHVTRQLAFSDYPG